MVGTGRDMSLQSSIPRMVLNDYGKIAGQQWRWLGEQYPYIVLHEFVVMPNHIHGIIEINRSLITSSDSIRIKSLSELMGAYKTTVSKQIHLAGFIEFKWQRSFYEHIIRDEESFETISDYILNNPVNWEQDTLFNL
jgi:putative transposase